MSQISQGHSLSGCSPGRPHNPPSVLSVYLPTYLLTYSSTTHLSIPLCSHLYDKNILRSALGWHICKGIHCSCPIGTNTIERAFVSLYLIASCQECSSSPPPRVRRGTLDSSEYIVHPFLHHGPWHRAWHVAELPKCVLN